MEFGRNLRGILVAVRCFLVGRSLYRFVRNEGIKECSVTLRPMKKNWFLVEMAAVDEECPAEMDGLILGAFRPVL